MERTELQRVIEIDQIEGLDSAVSLRVGEYLRNFGYTDWLQNNLDLYAGLWEARH